MTDNINLKRKLFHETKAPVANGIRCDETLLLSRFTAGAVNV